MNLDLTVNLGGIAMANPVTVASGTFGYGREYAGLVHLERLGAIIVKGTTLEPRPGNPPPRLVETPAGLLNAIGLMNPGVEAFVQQYLPDLQALGVPVIVNIAGNTLEEYAALAARLEQVEGVAGLEVNISCPNVHRGGLQFGSDPEMAARVTRAVKEHTRRPVIVKLSPNVTSITELARRVAEAGADALSLINTLPGLAIDIHTRRPVLGNVLGGLSGPAIKPVALRCVWQVYREVRLPILGMGGISCARDALEFIMAGASAVAIGTANFVNPRVSEEVLEGIREFMLAQGVKEIKELVGVAHSG
ncbi:MAG: dihydroorotate dehydrogenase [Desulfurispora sp.]|uniref:dihydroorotate dehydrogenase n=1 Tax=Desulfurispora sp. TaxID=3014275 RepID=UPI00404954FF